MRWKASGSRELGINRSNHLILVVADCISFATTFQKNIIAHTFRRSSLSAKNPAQLTCSVVNALATVRSRYQFFAGIALSPPLQKKAGKVSTNLTGSPV